ncbi:MAG: hypothetical protein ACRDHW_22120 [Ktedonobacteraceae bacterium]
MRLLIVTLSGDAPVQGFGYLNGYPWYFRARGDRWEFAVASGRDMVFDQAVAATAHKGFGLVLSKRFFDTTTLSEEKARAIIWRAARAAEAFMA